MREDTHTHRIEHISHPRTNLVSYSALNTHTFSACPRETLSRHDSTNVVEEKAIWQNLHTTQGQARRALSKIRGHDVIMFSRTHPHA